MGPVFRWSGIQIDYCDLNTGKDNLVTGVRYSVPLCI